MNEQLREFQMIQEGVIGFSYRPHNNPSGFVDLTLRLGLPPYNYDQNIGQSSQQASLFNQAMQYGCGNINNANKSYSGPINHPEKYKPTGAFVGQTSNNGSKRASESIQYGPSYSTDPNKSAFPPEPEMKNHILLNPSATNSNNTTDRTNTRAREGTSRRNKKKRALPAPKIEQEDKRCSNQDCGTNSTPMWRKGPLGPKSLCNACGIKYRKQEERKAEEAN
ncbi:GATA transcription factor [Parasponia andersonii]|uniref:GATA transcription factor n=1 Tax=Parasponia andersonii TaxID=3476 RepID=A0A2P5C3K1_PARAD|nr:GATA transcription factor [Parasponia andersonii]